MSDKDGRAIEQAAEDALEDFEKASEEVGPEGVPMLNRHILTAKKRLESALEDDYPW
jgi:hypothetical protein